MRKLLSKILSVVVAVTATLGLVMLPKTQAQASEFTFGAVQGASVKFGDTLEETGLRFTIEVDKEFYASLGDVEFGALLTTKSYADTLGEVVLDENDGMIANVCYVNDATKFDAEADSENLVYYASVTYLFNEEWKNEVVNQFAGTGLSDEEIFAKAKLAALATELVCRPYYIANGEVVYAELSDARSMLKVANATVIDGEKVTSDFAIKYLSSVVESDSEVYVDENGAVIGLSAADKEFIASATTYTADGSAGNIEFPIVDDVMDGDFLAGKQAGNYYYVTAFKGANALRIKYLYVTMFIDEAEDLDVFRFDYKNTGVIPADDGYYLVTKDIDASSYAMANHTFISGVVYPNSEDKKGGFFGTFDGNGHVISNLSVQSNGIFGWINDGATIKDIAFTNVTLLAGSYPTLFAHGLESSNNLPTTLSNIYVQVASMASESGVLINNGPSIHGTKYNNIIIDYTAFGEKELGWLNASGGRFGTITDFTVDAGQYKGMFNGIYTITSSPVMALRTANNAISNITVAGNKVTEVVAEDESISYTTTDANLQALLDKFGYTLISKNVQKDVKSYDTYADMAADAEANASKLATFSDEIWTVVNGVPYWKSLYNGMVELTIVDKDDNVVNPSDIVFVNNKTEYTVKLADDTHEISNVSIYGEGLLVDGNTFKLAEIPTSEGNMEITVSAIVNGIEITRAFTVAYSNKVIVDGKVLYSKYDKALDLPSLKAALAEVGEDISSLADIDNYVVGGVDVNELDLEVIISNNTSKDYGRNRAVDTAQEVRFNVDGKLFVLTNVYAYTKLIDEAEDLNVFIMKGATEENPYNEVDGYFLVTKNIDASNLDLDNHVFMSGAVYPGNGYNADVGFRGVLDGQGYVIDGLTAETCGLFASMNAAVVKNVAFTNAKLTGYYLTLFTKNYLRGKDYANGFNGYEGMFQNVYISISSIDYYASNGHAGILTQGTMPGTIAVENVIVELANVDKTTQSMIDKGNQFLMFGASTSSMANNAAQYKNCYSISTAPVLQLAKMPGFAENQVEHTYSGSKVTSVGSVLDEQVNEVLTRCGKELAVDHVIVGLRAYDDYAALAADASDRNAASLATYGDCWIVKNGVPYWKEVYKKGFATEVKQGDAVVEGEILLKDSKTEITLNILDLGGNAVDSTITAPEGITVNGNVIKLASEPNAVGAYEVKITAVVEGIVIERYITVNYSNAYDIDGKVLYSQVDKALDLDSLNAAGVEIESLDEIEGYVVAGEEVEVLDLEVIISGSVRTRTVDTAQEVVVKAGGKVYNLTSVYAYTKLFDDVTDLDWLTRQMITVADYEASGASDWDGLTLYTKAEVDYVYDTYDGIYLMTKNISGAGLGVDGADYQLAGTMGSTASKDTGFTGVFDGNGYTISNVSLPSRGLFTFIKGGVVKNVGFKACEINGYYPVVLTHALTNYDIDGNSTKDIPLIKNIYVEGTIVDLTYTQSGREGGILAQNNFYTYAENVVVKHTMTEVQKGNITVKRFAVLHTQYYHTKDLAGNKGMNAFYKDFYVISDAPLAFGTHATNTTWSHFLLAQNTVQVNAETNKWELKDATKFAFLESLLTRTYTLGGVEYTWDTSADVITDKIMAIDVVSTMYHYASAGDMATAGNDYTTFDSSCWTIVDGIPMWTTAM